jgi:diphthamide synthase (EF-2-diphthine--ammonia ligase)
VPDAGRDAGEGLKVLFFSGGKESVYAYHLERPVDLLFISVYQFPRPSPHLLNLHKTLELALALGVPTLVVRLPRGGEFKAKAELLRRVGARVLVAGDQSVDEHLKYMERLAREAGAKLREPLWGRDPEALLMEELEVMDFLVIGAAARDLVCARVTRDSAREFLRLVRDLGMDPIGERGEYHTLVVRYGGVEIPYKCERVEQHADYYIARLA